MVDEPQDDGDFEDEFPSGPGGKKRKVPAQARTFDMDGDVSKSTSTSSMLLRSRIPRTDARRLCEFRKALFLRRKAALIALYIEAQNAITAATAKPLSSSLPDVNNFEKLLPSLEDMGVRAWTPDKPGWRNGLEQDWRARKRRVARKPIERLGWAPEGSFEFEMECQASIIMRARSREQGTLLKLAHELRAVVLALKPPPPKVEITKDRSPNKTRRKLVNQDPPLAERKTKKKKKKRSVLANQSNPHHVDNYRPSRGASPQNPHEPYPQHLDLVAPPPMRLLAARPNGSIRPAEDDFLCCFCEFDLYYGSEKARRRAIRQRRRELKRKEMIMTKARNVAEGRGTFKDENDDEEDDCGHDRCTCGRAVADGPTLDDDG